MCAVLAHEIIGDSSPLAETVFVLHGILGSKRNWQGFCKRLATDLPGRRFVTVDLRNHGDSHGFEAPHTMEACAQDLLDLADDLGSFPEAVIGHSFGGKTALAYADLQPENLKQVWVLDAIPDGSVEPIPDDHMVLSVVRTLRKVPLPVERRAAVEGILTELGLPRSIARWMTTNLSPGRRGGYVWSFDLDAIPEMIGDYHEHDGWLPLRRKRPEAPEVVTVRAALSTRWTRDVLERFQRLPPDAAGRLLVLPKADHWLHVDNPTGLRRMLTEHWWSARKSRVDT